MKATLKFAVKSLSQGEVILLGAYAKKSKVDIAHWEKAQQDAFKALKASKHFKGAVGSTFSFNGPKGENYLALGLGAKKEINAELLRKQFATALKSVKGKYASMTVAFDHFMAADAATTAGALGESFGLTNYSFEKYLSKKSENVLKTVSFESTSKKDTKAVKAFNEAKIVTDAVNVGRNFTNEPPNVLRSTEYAKRVKADVKGMDGVKVKVLGKAQLKKEKMGLFLSVNAGSGFEPQLVHLTYTPAKTTKKTKHIALVGKGLVFDTGGYSLKPGGSMVNMKFDMAGSATVYSAFKAIAAMKADVKVTCILGMTDNAVNELATMPDAICTARNGKTVEILNTDAEGRLVLADCLDYACDLKPDAIIDAATLTGACLVALGTEVCGVMSNNEKLSQSLLDSAKKTDEYMWELPIVPEFEKAMKSDIADLKNISNGRWGGTPKAAAFLKQFIKNDIPWAHLDIAGVADGQSHLPYCPAKGASGVIVRTLVDYIKNA